MASHQEIATKCSRKHEYSSRTVYCHSGYLDELYCGLHSELTYLYSTQDSGRYTVQGRIQDFKLGGGGALKKIAPSGGRRENFWGILCEKSRFYAKKSYFRGRGAPPWIRPCGRRVTSQIIKVTLCILMLQRAITQILLRRRCSLKCMLQLYDKFTISSHIGGVMISVLASSAVDRGFEHRLGQTKDKKKVFVASPLSTQH